MSWEDTSIPVVASIDGEDQAEGFEEDSELDLNDGEDFSDDDFEDEENGDGDEDDDYDDYEDDFEDKEPEPHHRPEWR